MKKTLKLGALLSALVLTTPSLLRADTVTLDVKGMTCAICAARLEVSLKKVAGVSKVVVDNKTGKANVDYDATKVSADKIVDACNKLEGLSCR